MIDVFKILKNTKVEGPGERFCIWVQGCKKHCPGCWARETWEFGIGKKYSVDDILKQIKSISLRSFSISRLFLDFSSSSV